MVGLGDTRLDDDATETCRLARGGEARARGEASTRTLTGLCAAQRAEALAARSGATRANWQSGSHKDECDIWRGGVALGSYGDAAAREFSVVDDARGWERYTGGRIYQGKEGKVMVVVVLYAPDAQSMMY